MPSFQYHLFKPMMRLNRWMQGRFPADDVSAYAGFSRRSDRMAAMTMRLPSGVSLEQSTIGGVKGEWLIPQGAPESPLLVYVHGGGIVFGWNAAFRREVAYIAQFAGLRAFGVDYRLMPGNPCPAAHDDCFTVYKTLAEQGRQVVLIGESSGGVLSLAVLLRAKSAGLPQPPLCVLISPTVDYAFRNQRIWNSDDPFIHPNFVVQQHRHYTAGCDLSSPDLAPIDADLRSIAPLYVLTAEHDVLRCESERLAQAAQQHDVSMELVFAPHVWHGWTVLAPQLPEATHSLKLLGDTIRHRLGR
jgi:acetyl esterase/lipase